jgi:ADP-ribose pyrophosphatase YjhB (NUDIX family)
MEIENTDREVEEIHAENEPVRTRCAGGIVIGDGGTLALEADEDAARREVQEESGLSELELIADLGTYSRPGIHRDGTYNHEEIKDIHMYLFAAQAGAKVTPSMEIAEARWASYREVASLLEDAKDTVWFATVFDRVREAIQRD